MEIRLRFALDSNGDRQIQPEEVVGHPGRLKSQDGDGDEILKGRELQDVYYEFAPDAWVPAGRKHRVEQDGIACTLELRSLALKTGRIDLRADCRPS